MLLLGLKKVLGILEKCHISGEEAKAYSEALDIIKAFIKVLEEGEKGDARNGNHAEHGEKV